MSATVDRREHPVVVTPTSLSERARSAAADTVHATARTARRASGLARLHRAPVTGIAAAAVVRALRGAILNRPTPQERAWIDRIELMRRLMARSPQELTVVDFGAGVASEFDTGVSDLRHTSIRTLAQMTRASKPPEGGYLLFRLVRDLRAQTALELGACVGISASYLGAAMELNGTGRLITLEGADVLAARSARTLEELLLDSRAEVRVGQFAETLDSAVADLAPLGLAFVDGHHVESATLDYLNAIAPAMAEESVMVFDDISWSAGMRRAWHTIEGDERFALTVDLQSVGLAVISASSTTRTSLSIPYY